MSETPTSGANPGQGAQATPPVTPTGNEGTGNPADAAPTQSNPTDSSSVSDEQGAQSLEAQEAAQEAKRDEVAEANAEHQQRVDHEGTGPGEEPAPASDVEEPDGTDNA